MDTKKYLIMVILCALTYCSIYAQEIYRETNVQQSHPAILQEAMKIDWSKSPDIEVPNPSIHSPRRANNGWYPIKGEVYAYDETEVAGHLYFEIGQNGLLDKRIIVCNNPNLYDSTVSVMNRTPYTRGKDLLDTTYNYWRQPDGSYKLDLRRTYSYHYFDYFEADSFYYEVIYHTWNDANKQWENFIRQKRGYHDTLIEFRNRTVEYSGQGNIWKLAGYLYDSVTYNQHGLVDTLYVIYDFVNKLPSQKLCFTYDEQDRYTQIDYFIRRGNNWDKDRVHSNITWTEWNGFTYDGGIVIGGEVVSPYKRNKIKSYYIDDRIFYQKQWDINGTKSNSDTTWSIIDGKLYYYNIIDNIYNEYGDYVKNVYIHYYYPDENGAQEIEIYDEWYYKYVYDEIYGMTEEMVYNIRLLDGGKMDTLFHSGFKYTEFAPVGITEHPQLSKQTLNITPNTTSGVVTITAATEIEQLAVFDITGRLVSSQTPTSRQVTFDTGVLPKGVYLVQARLRDGGVMTGKVVVR